MKLNYHEIVPSVIMNSQKGQDAFIQATFDKIGYTNKYYVDLGATDGFHLSNVSFLRERDGWTGLLLEGDTQYLENKDINLYIKRISKDNVCDLFNQYSVPEEFDFLCVDLDGMDYWILKSVLEKYRPRVVMVETNVRFEPDESYTLKYDDNWNWDGSAWYGASPLAFKKLFESFGFSVVWVHVDDMIAIKDEVLDFFGYEKPEWSYVYPSSNKSLYDTHTRGGRLVTEIDINDWEEV